MSDLDDVRAILVRASVKYHENGRVRNFHPTKVGGDMRPVGTSVLIEARNCGCCPVELEFDLDGKLEAIIGLGYEI